MVDARRWPDVAVLPRAPVRGALIAALIPLRAARIPVRLGHDVVVHRPGDLRRRIGAPADRRSSPLRSWPR